LRLIPDDVDDDDEEDEEEEEEEEEEDASRSDSGFPVLPRGASLSPLPASSSMPMIPDSNSNYKERVGGRKGW
jgi:hypothetical protein